MGYIWGDVDEIEYAIKFEKDAVLIYDNINNKTYETYFEMFIVAYDRDGFEHPIPDEETPPELFQEITKVISSFIIMKDDGVVEPLEKPYLAHVDTENQRYNLKAIDENEEQSSLEE